MYHDRTAWPCAFLWEKNMEAKANPQGNAAHMGIPVYPVYNAQNILITLWVRKY
jgi:hypothetical protein